MSAIEPSLNPYEQQNPFELLGVDPSVSVEELRDAMEERLEELEYEQIDAQEKHRRREQISAAYESLKKATSRFAVELCLMDPTVGREACRKEAQKHLNAKVDVSAMTVREDDVFPTRPALGPKQMAGQPFTLEKSLRLAEPRGKFSPNPQVEAAESITFDR